MNDDDLLRVYNRKLIALSAETEAPKRLANPAYAARAISPVCGSEVAVEFTLTDGKVAEFGYEVDACALTKTVVAVMKKSILGKTREEISRAGNALRIMLDGGEAPSGDWRALEILAPVADYKARHNSILLPFEAVEKAFEKGPEE